MRRGIGVGGVAHGELAALHIDHLDLFREVGQFVV